MLRKYNYLMGIAVIFFMIAACGENGVSSSANNNNASVADVSFDIGESEDDVTQDVKQSDSDISETDDTSEGDDISGDDTTTPPDLCEMVGCLDFSTCDPQTGQCVCDEGYFEAHDEDGIAIGCVDQCVTMRCGENTSGCVAGVCLCAEGYEKTDEGCTLIPTGLCVDRQKPCPAFAHCIPETGDCQCDFGEANPSPGEEIGQDQLVCKTFCEAARCPENKTCDVDIQQCVCDEGFIESGDECIRVVPDLCENKTCQLHATCNAQTGDCDCDFGSKEGVGGVNDPAVCKGPCEAMQCLLNSTCDPRVGQCVCDPGYILVEGQGCQQI